MSSTFECLCVQDDFENIQSTNWRSMRWKPPVLDVGLLNAPSLETPNTEDVVTPSAVVPACVEKSPDRAALQAAGPGWRTEFRTLEIQLTDFENAAFAALVVLMSKAMLARGYSFMIPMSYVHENMCRAQLKDAVLTQKFWFRANSGKVNAGEDHRPAQSVADRHRYDIPARSDIDLVEMTLDEIMNGVPGGGASKFPGLLQLVRDFVQHDLPTSEDASASAAQLQQRTELAQLESYLALLSARASGELPTAARWMRNYVTRHPAYARGSGRLTPAVADDLLKVCDAIGMGEVLCPELYGESGARYVGIQGRLGQETFGQSEGKAVLHPEDYAEVKLLGSELDEASRKNRSSCISNCS
jgi:glutamate--cysteine ligase catalytic subunit